MYKIIGSNQLEYGPLTAEQLRQYIVEGRADANTQTKYEGTENWKPLSSFPEFASALNIAPPGYVHPSATTITTTSPKNNGMAITSLVFGLLSFFLGWLCCLGPLFSLLGVIFGFVGISQINKNPNVQTGKGMAISGIILSVIGLVVSVIIILIFGLLGALGDALNK
jgi:hypothetical protein